MINDISFNYLTEEGLLKKYIIIDKFNKDTKDFIIYKEENKDELYTSLYEIINDKIKIIPIEKEEDYNTVDEYLERL